MNLDKVCDKNNRQIEVDNVIKFQNKFYVVYGYRNKPDEEALVVIDKDNNVKLLPIIYCNKYEIVGYDEIM